MPDPAPGNHPEEASLLAGGDDGGDKQFPRGAPWPGGGERVSFHSVVQHGRVIPLESKASLPELRVLRVWPSLGSGRSQRRRHLSWILRNSCLLGGEERWGHRRQRSGARTRCGHHVTGRRAGGGWSGDIIGPLRFRLFIIQPSQMFSS